MLRSLALTLTTFATIAFTTGCNDLDSEKGARIAYVGLDKAVVKSLALGFQGFNAADSANIPEQSTTGDEMGTLIITGQVDQGSSDNKGMRLFVSMKDYSDGAITLPAPDDDTTSQIRYQTSEDSTQLPALTLSLRGIPSTLSTTGTYSGTLIGLFNMVGDLEGPVQLNLTMSGEIIMDPTTGQVVRKAGSTIITGVATSDSGVYEVNVSL